MATVNSAHQVVRRTDLRDEDHPVWTKTFKYNARLQQLQDDHEAWAAVTGVLITIVSMGALLAIISVAICMF
jgi:hypothetical protein